MTTTLRRLIGVLALFVTADLAQAADAYVARFHSRQAFPGQCAEFRWEGGLRAFNRGPDVAAIRVLEVSDGLRRDLVGQVITVPPLRVVDMGRQLNAAGSGEPLNSAMYFVRLDAPSTVTLESSSQFSYGTTCIPGQEPAESGHAPMPVFRALRAPLETQVHLHTDRGQRASRTNVLIYNGGVVDALARVEVRRECDGSIVDNAAIVIPSHATRQVSGLRSGIDACPSPSGGAQHAWWARYTTVTVDQPSVSIVSSIAESTDGRDAVLADQLSIAVGFVP